MLALCATKNLLCQDTRLGSDLVHVDSLKGSTFKQDRQGCDICRGPEKEAGLYFLSKPTPPSSVTVDILHFCSFPR